MFKGQCPECGALVKFEHSLASLSVCRYCGTACKRDDQAVIRIGKRSAALSVFSVLQIGTYGKFKGEGFRVLGFLQAQYRHGFWVEWFIVFDNGKTGWLYEACGHWSIVSAVSDTNNANLLSKNVELGSHLELDAKGWVVTEKREVSVKAMAGQLPFEQLPGSNFMLIEAKYGSEVFIVDKTLGKGSFFQGRYVSFEELSLQNLRDVAKVGAEGARLDNLALISIACPSCGNTQDAPQQGQFNVVCSKCHTSFYCGHGQAIKHDGLDQTEAGGSLSSKESSDWFVNVSNKSSSVARSCLAIQVGREFERNGISYTVMGVLVKAPLELADRSDMDASNLWTEAMLIDSVGRICWASKEFGAPMRIYENLSETPYISGSSLADSRYIEFQERFFKSAQAPFQVCTLYVAGVLDTRVRVGDLTVVREFSSQGMVIEVEEVAAEELVFNFCAAPEQSEVELDKHRFMAPNYLAAMFTILTYSIFSGWQLPLLTQFLVLASHYVGWHVLVYPGHYGWLDRAILGSGWKVVE